ncbi:MAG: hypothetical protein OXF49_00900 [Candidatus Saccharibacteria bacterium]|nr:hypothetical protein [Candidatus Saccharibacteria bacterium]
MYLFIESNPQYQAGLYLISTSANFKIVDQLIWTTNQDLAETLLKQIVIFLKSNNLALSDLRGLGVFAGPAGFTDLRVTHVIANTLAYSLQIPITNAQTKTWQEQCFKALRQGQNFKIIKPFYGRLPTITKPKK